MYLYLLVNKDLIIIIIIIIIVIIIINIIISISSIVFLKNCGDKLHRVYYIKLANRLSNVYFSK